MPSHTRILKVWSSRLTHPVAAEISPSALDVQVPVIQIGKELGTSQHESKGRVNRRKEATGGKVNTTVGFDVGEEDSKCILCSVEPVYHLEKTAARCGSLYSMLCSMARRETLLMAALEVKGQPELGLGQLLPDTGWS